MHRLLNNLFWFVISVIIVFGTLTVFYACGWFQGQKDNTTYFIDWRLTEQPRNTEEIMECDPCEICSASEVKYKTEWVVDEKALNECKAQVLNLEEFIKLIK